MSTEEEISLFASTSRKRLKLVKEDSGELKTKKAKAPSSEDQHALEEELRQLREEGAKPTAEDLHADEDASFKDLGLSEWLQKVCSSLGMTRPTPVQRGCIPAVLQGRDVIGVAHTGSGKTAAFALPIIQKLSKDPYGIYALVLTPTRELAFQLADQFKALGAGLSLKELVIVGGLDMQHQAKELARRPHVVIATPGRLKGLIDLDASLGRGFSRTAFFVMDEADRLLEPSFEEELTSILQCLPLKRQTLLFSATMASSIATLREGLLQDAFQFEAYTGLQTAEHLREEYLFLPLKIKEVYLVHLLEGMKEKGVRSAVVFTSTCKACQFISTMLAELDIPCATLHSKLPQKARLSALDKFRSGNVSILLTTDVGSRGLDIPTVDWVINFDLPKLVKDYVHRVGRTARAGREGCGALSFVSQYDISLLQKIENLIGRKLEKYEECEEKEVLKSITRVYAAKRTAALAIQ